MRENIVIYTLPAVLEWFSRSGHVPVQNNQKLHKQITLTRQAEVNENIYP